MRLPLASRPVLADAVRLHRREIRGEHWLFMQNTISGENVRVSADYGALLERFDGSRSLGQALDEWRAESASWREVTDAEIQELLVTLAGACMLRFGDEAETTRLLERARQGRDFRTRSRWNPLGMRIPLFDPDRELERCLRRVRPLFSRAGFVAILVLLAAGALVFIAMFPAVMRELGALVENPGGWWLYPLIFPFMKLVHELAHALALKRWGGSVHEIGIGFLVLMPVPYVDASDMWLLPERWQRVTVAAAGMVAELVVGAVGVLIWALLPGSFVATIGFSTAVLALTATLLFNANPLLKFDGYQILQEVLAMPNLATRSMRLLRYFCRRYLFGVATAEPPIVAPGEYPWLLIWGVAATLYRVLLVFIITVYLYGILPLVGLLLAGIALWQLLCRPLFALVGYLARSPELRATRRRAAGFVIAVVLAALSFALLLPLPMTSRIEGVVDVPRQARIVAAEDARIARLEVAEGQWVARGDTLLTLSSDALELELAAARSRVTGLEVEIGHARIHDRASLERLRAEAERAIAERDALLQRKEALQVRAAVSGRVAPAGEHLVQGAYVRRGDALLYLVADESMVVRAVVPERRMGRFDREPEKVTVRLAEKFDTVHMATLVRETPAANRHLPSESLASNGSYGIAVAEREGGVMETLEPVFHLEFALPPAATTRGIGGKAYLEITHAPATLAARWWTSLRQLLIDTKDT
ncbi:MAG: hypothetical protein CSB44_12430 [Gammaproteobacteria bacterium]|nr:MAG: hypothetical protein CSB44_12430 [Gammaproteobacteria bacterium]